MEAELGVPEPYRMNYELYQRLVEADGEWLIKPLEECGIRNMGDVRWLRFYLVKRRNRRVLREAVGIQREDSVWDQLLTFLGYPEPELGVRSMYWHHSLALRTTEDCDFIQVWIVLDTLQKTWFAIVRQLAFDPCSLMRDHEGVQNDKMAVHSRLAE